MRHAPAYSPGAGQSSAGPVGDTLAGSMLAGAGAIGLGCTLLPLLTLTVGGDGLAEAFGEDLSRSEIEVLQNSSVSVAVGFYDFLASSLLVSAAIPLALLVALFAGGALLAGYSSKNLVAVSGLSSVIALLLVVFLAIRPTMTFSGEFDGVALDTVDESLMGWTFGAGFYVTVSMVAVAAAVAVWSSLRRR